MVDQKIESYLLGFYLKEWKEGMNAVNDHYTNRFKITYDYLYDNHGNCFGDRDLNDFSRDLLSGNHHLFHESDFYGSFCHVMNKGQKVANLPKKYLFSNGDFLP